MYNNLRNRVSTLTVTRLHSWLIAWPLQRKNSRYYVTRWPITFEFNCSIVAQNVWMLSTGTGSKRKFVENETLYDCTYKIFVWNFLPIKYIITILEVYIIYVYENKNFIDVIRINNIIFLINTRKENYMIYKFVQWYIMIKGSKYKYNMKTKIY